MAERFKAHAWKVCIPFGYRGFESHSLRHKICDIIERIKRRKYEWFRNFSSCCSWLLVNK